MANYVVAVSGGIDSVVLLDMLSKTDHHLVVAHVDHGIRGEDSASDARFVAALARYYELPFVTTELKLGTQASEELARNGRYSFLFRVASEHDARVVTAHHADDVVETIALNLTRGTGWRGLAIMSRNDVVRPLIALTKQQLYNYALAHRLEWVEDATNYQKTYLRNRLRAKLANSHTDTAALQRLRARQLRLRQDIERETDRVLRAHEGSRYFLSMLEETVALEVLGTAIHNTTGKRPVRPQLLRALHAVRTALPRKIYKVGDGISIEFTARTYRIQDLAKK